MKKNLSTIDRVARILFAVVVSVLFAMHVISGTLGFVLLAVGAILAVTALINFCPIYWSMGISTKEK